MQLGANGLRYEWIEGWADLSAPAVGRAWPHHGIVAADDDLIVSFHPSEPQLLFFDCAGEVRRAVPTEIVEAHGITVSVVAGQQRLWLADAAMRKDAERAYASAEDDSGSAVLEVDLDGRVLRRLPRPPAELYRDGQYRPTCAVAFDARYGGNGDIWVADGYGSNLVHRFTSASEHVAALTGLEGAGSFEVPHALLIDTRHGDPELYVADRANGRIQVYDMDGTYRRAVGEAFLSRPTWMAVHDGWLFVVEFLPPRLTVLDVDDQLVTIIGEDVAAPDRDEWPNQLDPAGDLMRPSSLAAGRFNSPHAIAVDHVGNIYVTEWLIGGRTTKLQRQPPAT